MDPSVRRCFASVSDGLSEIRVFDQILAAGDLEKAADRLSRLWNKLYEPTQTLTNLYEGEFWKDWQGRAAFESNLRQVYDLLNADLDDQTVDTMECVRDYLHANFSLLKDSIHLLAADTGLHALNQPSLEKMI